MNESTQNLCIELERVLNLHWEQDIEVDKLKMHVDDTIDELS